MKGPYQITREYDAENGKVLFELVDTRNNETIRRQWTTGKHLFAPSELRLLQAKLNTSAMLD